ncbi:hypothetical protein DB30_01233 [Enhygromyxa salina]|uniref:Uncharacterized protein n=1 Tax=Enhygromyxa salina TaxID=215803 RepID=A0A0C2CSE8_9BACT|nr:hypothetical protein [Enhygromyxa salina]KIG12570.1 hypothetical protein DB30_01233 [Enhygromyxa salina]
MFIKPTILAILAACGINSNPPDAPDEIEPPDDQQIDQHFCCQSVSAKPWSGEGCVTIAVEHINTCAKVLYCPGKWINDEGDVTCE